MKLHKSHENVNKHVEPPLKIELRILQKILLKVSIGIIRHIKIDSSFFRVLHMFEVLNHIVRVDLSHDADLNLSVFFVMLCDDYPFLHDLFLLTFFYLKRRALA